MRVGTEPDRELSRYHEGFNGGGGGGGGSFDGYEGESSSMS